MPVDLKVAFGDISDTPSIFPKEEGVVEVTISNQGDSTFSGSTDLALFASTDNRLERRNRSLQSQRRREVLNINEDNPTRDLDGDVLEGEDEVLTDLVGTEEVDTITVDGLDLAPGESTTVTIDFASDEVRTPSVVAPGAYYLFAQVDPNNTIPESRNGNNVGRRFISTDGSNVVQDWNSVYLNAVQASGADAYGFSSPSSGDTGTIPPVVPRNGALLHTAIYDTVLAFEGGFEPFAIDREAPAGASVEAAVVGAAFTILSSDQVYAMEPVSPEDEEITIRPRPEFEDQKDRSLAEIDATQAEKDAGFAFGEQLALDFIELRSNDFAVPPSEEFVPPDRAGAWRPSIDGEAQNPEGPQFESVPQFFIPTTQQFRTDGPPTFGSNTFAEETEEAREIGAVADTDITTVTRSDLETEIAQFWSFDRPDTFRPPGHWNLITQETILQARDSGVKELSLLETARLFAQLNIALTDAGVVSWDSKFDFAQLRPEQTINANPEDGIIPRRNFGFDNIDGNPISIQDPDWDPLIGTPPFPDYTSGHAAFGGAAAGVLASVFGENFVVEATTQDIPGLDRDFTFGQGAEENGESRVFGGIHVRNSSVEGLASGRAIGDFVAAEALEPLEPVV